MEKTFDCRWIIEHHNVDKRMGERERARTTWSHLELKPPQTHHRGVEKKYMPFTAPQKRARPALATLPKNTVTSNMVVETGASSSACTVSMPSAAGKKRAISETASQEESSAKKNKTLSQTVPISSGCQEFDFIIPGGGFRSSQILEIFGKSGTGKTQACLSFAATVASAPNSKVVWIGTNRSFRPERVREILRHRHGYSSVDDPRAKKVLDQIMYAEAANGLQGIMVLMRGIKRFFGIKLLIIDSIAAAYKCTRELLNMKVDSSDDRVEVLTEGTKAKVNSGKTPAASAKIMLSKLLTDLSTVMHEKKFATILVNEVVADFSKDAKSGTVRPATSLTACTPRHIVKLSRSDISKKRKASSLSKTNAVQLETFFDITEEGLVADDRPTQSVE